MQTDTENDCLEWIWGKNIYTYININAIDEILGIYSGPNSYFCKVVPVPKMLIMM